MMKLKFKLSNNIILNTKTGQWVEIVAKNDFEFFIEISKEIYEEWGGYRFENIKKIYKNIKIYKQLKDDAYLFYAPFGSFIYCEKCLGDFL